jgi:signal transduction histidine kinase
VTYRTPGPQPRAAHPQPRAPHPGLISALRSPAQEAWWSLRSQAGPALWPAHRRRDADPADPAEAPRRTQALIARTIAVLRIAQVVPWPVAVALGAQSGIQHLWLAGIVYGVQTGWSLVWATIVVARSAIPSWAMLIDVGVAASCLVLAGLACYPQDATTWANSAVAPAMGTAVAAAAAWPLIASAAAGLLLALAYLSGVIRGLTLSDTAWAATVGNITSLLGFAVIAGLVSHYLMRLAGASAATAVELAAARARRASEESRDAERTRQYRMLHDTVLSTLSALARGGLDPSDPLVRQRCAADADYLRGLISSGGTSAGNQLQGELAAVGRSQAALGLRVHVHCADVPSDLPEPVVRGLTDACREALNNVIKHSGDNQAWVTAVGLDPHAPGGPLTTLTITDRGRGFDPARVGPGLGMRESISGRMSEIGGAAHVDSRPGQGTTVELAWPG